MGTLSGLDTPSSTPLLILERTLGSVDDRQGAHGASGFIRGRGTSHWGPRQGKPTRPFSTDQVVEAHAP